jgi:hypothetical protein
MNTETRNLRNRATAAHAAGLIDRSFLNDVFSATEDCGWYNAAIDRELAAVGA